ncbi:MAG: manganese efflux pump [Bacteroidales bacterium]|nr:manganese efflux pump [Bacteroidales bacterium]
MSWWEAILMAVSLCADCFAVTLCSSMTLKRIRWSNVATIALVFAVIQTGLLVAGWLVGSLLASFVIRISHIIGFLLLLYVGGSMLLEGIRGKDEARDLNGLWHIIIGGIATSIDALAVGTSMSIEGQPWSGFFPLAVSVFAVTALSAVLGICGGKFIGTKTGRVAEILGGLVLIGIGVSFLF